MLYIYKASAGSGKTHLLTGFYLRLLFRKELTNLDDTNRTLLFNEILAVTFTNKATAEMKERIIDELALLVEDPNKSDYRADLMKPDADGKQPTEQQIRAKAKSILSAMLNDYTDLHVSTIDSFFQRVLRNFAHELNTQGSYELELDQDQVLDHAVSQFLLRLDKERDPETFQWMIDFTSSRIDEGATWNVHDSLLELAKVLTTEDYKRNSKPIAEFANQRDHMRSIVHTLKELQRNYRNELKEIGRKGSLILTDNQLTYSMFKGKNSSPMSCFGKWEKGQTDAPGKKLLEMCENTDAWYSSDSEAKGKLKSDQEQELLELMNQGVELLTGPRHDEYCSAKAIAENFYQLGLLSKLEEEANRYCEEQGVQLLSRTTEILNRLVRDESSPFIYEKTGTQIHSFMIDEFQDTSGMQWENFRPLLDNSLGEGCQNLVVGDVKQSIYRWRGSDWQLLNSVLPSFRPEMQAIDENGNQLTVNYRSADNIVHFNNSFFEYAARQMALLDEQNPEMQQIVNIYSDVEQKVRHQAEKWSHPLMREGIVRIELLPKDGKKSAMDATLKRLPEVVMEVQKQGYKAKDILILGRQRKEYQRYAEALLQYGKEHPDSPYCFNVITNEALRISGCEAVRAVVAMMQYIQEPKSALRRMNALSQLYKTSGISTEAAIDRYFDPATEHPDILQYSNKPLYEMVESLILLLPDQGFSASTYLQALRDVALEYAMQNGPDLGGFLHWWDEKGQSQSISTPGEQDAIRIMTIHQSKGLAGRVVIIPSASWIMDIDTSHHESLWCTPTHDAFGLEGMLLPIKLDTDLRTSIFKPDYDKERLRAIIDNLNTAYVAFTRAQEVMIIMAPEPSKTGSRINLENLLQGYLTSHGEIPSLDFNTAPQAWQKTEGSSEGMAEQESIEQKYDLLNMTASSPFDTQAAQPVIKQSETADAEGPIARGETIHAALAAIKHKEDIEAPVMQLFRSGRAEVHGITLDELLPEVKHMVQLPEVSEWFDINNRVLCEQDITTHHNHTQRPDRVVFTPDGRTIVIDYKTGAEDTSDSIGSHRWQVKHYMKLLNEMGFEHIEGYLWYLYPHKIVKIE